MYLFVQSINARTRLDAVEGKNLARLARECFFNHQPLTLDFLNVGQVSQAFCQALLCPLTNEFGADFLNQWLQLKNLSAEVSGVMQFALSELDGYFDGLDRFQAQSTDQEIVSLNSQWLIKARELCRDKPLCARYILGITDQDLRQAIGRLPLEDIEYIAQSGWLWFAPRVSNHLFAQLNAKQRSGIDVLLTLSGGE
jgi:hypothetical protein